MNKRTWGLILSSIIITIIYFSYNITLGYDSSHYIWLSTMFTEQVSFSNWDVVRSFVFPFGIYLMNILFGKNSLALQIGTFIFYVVMIAVCINIYKDIVLKNEKNKFIKLIIIAFYFFIVAFNPIIFGFYHVILTEFVAMTLIMLMCYLSWKWISCDFGKNKIEYIIYTVVFAILTCFSWHLKQPYILVALIPLITATIISICKNPKKINILQRLSVIGISIIMLFISILGWNKVLEIANVNKTKDRTTSGLVDNIIINGLSMYQRDRNPEMHTIEGVQKNEYLSNNDKEKMIEILNGKNNEYKNYIIFNYKPEHKMIEQSYVLYLKEEKVETSESLQFFKYVLTKHPDRVIESYVMNYLTIFDIYKLRVDMTYGMQYYIDRTFELGQNTEINFLAYSIFRNSRNDLDLPEYYSQYSQEYISVNTYIPAINKIMEKRMAPAVGMFKIVMMFLPVYWIISILLLVINRKKHKEEYFRIQTLIVILLTYSVGQIALYVLAGSIVDRYAVPPYLATLMAIILQIYNIFRIKKIINVEGIVKNETTNKKNSGESKNK